MVLWQIIAPFGIKSARCLGWVMMDTKPHYLHVQPLELSERIKALQKELESPVTFRACVHFGLWELTQSKITGHSPVLWPSLCWGFVHWTESVISESKKMSWNTFLPLNYKITQISVKETFWFPDYTWFLFLCHFRYNTREAVHGFLFLPA